jgi:hypothetical protein
MDTRTPGLRRHLTLPNVLSTLAVFLVLAGGTAFAAGLKKNSVSSRAVRDNSLTSADLADGKGVMGADVADGSLGGADIADSSLGRGSFALGSIGGADLGNASVASAEIGDGAVAAAQLGPKSVNSATIADGSLRGADFSALAITGRNVDESTLARVPETTRLGGFLPGEFVSSVVFELVSPLEVGIPLGDGTFRISISCLPGDVLLSGGPSDVAPSSTLVESFPKDGTWTVRINPHGANDPFRVSLNCALQGGLPR